MVGIWKSYSDVFLIIVGVVTLVSFGLPLTFAPLRWARLFRWEVPQSQALVTFLGRSLGVFISIISIMAFMVIRTPLAMPFFFDLLIWLFAGMIVLHVYGAIRRVQPFTETLEILLWVMLSFITLGFYPI
jgi:hypothetical protein